MQTPRGGCLPPLTVNPIVNTSSVAAPHGLKMRGRYLQLIHRPVFSLQNRLNDRRLKHHFAALETLKRQLAYVNGGLLAKD